MKDLRLSFIITTKDKFTFLFEALGRLIEAKEDDEEIVVVDGGSTDGTVDYLKELTRKGYVHQFVSEIDFGEAHGLNKGLLMAKGDLIKVITDDDVFYFPGISKCKSFMLQNPQLDVINTNGAVLNWTGKDPFWVADGAETFNSWVERGQPFASCGLGLMLRKSSLPLIGLFYPGVLRVDMEYTFRLMLPNINMGWYTGFTYVRISNEYSNSFTESERYAKEGKQIEEFYRNLLGRNRSKGNSLLESACRLAKKTYRRLKPNIAKREQRLWLEGFFKMKTDVESSFKMCLEWLRYQDSCRPGVFLIRKERGS